MKKIIEVIVIGRNCQLVTIKTKQTVKRYFTIKTKQTAKRYLIHKNKYGFVDVYNANYATSPISKPIYTTSIALKDSDIDIKSILATASLL